MGVAGGPVSVVEVEVVVVTRAGSDGPSPPGSPARKPEQDTMSSDNQGVSRRDIGGLALWHVYRGFAHRVGDVFGPLNGVRIALVAASAVAAIAAFIAGYAAAGIILLAGVALHGLGWLYLWRQRDTTPSD